MPPMWWKVIKTLLILFALFTTIGCINSEISKRREAAAAAAAAATAVNGATANDIDTNMFVGNNLMQMMQGSVAVAVAPDQRQQQEQPVKAVELAAEKDYDELVKIIFKVNVTNSTGVTLFNTTTIDDASFMPIPTMLGEQPAQQQQQLQQLQQQQQQKPNHYHQYQRLNHQQQSFKVQRSPDGKLNLVFNDPLVSLQSTQQEQQPQRPAARLPPSDTFVFPDQIATGFGTSPAPIDTGDHQCADGFNQSRSFCTKVSNYPDISALQSVLARKFANFFSDDPQPTEFGLRMNDDEQYLCKSNVKYLYPELGQTVDKSWQVIVNTKQFKQGILIEECDKEGERCSFMDSLVNHYVPVCKQHYIVRHLATVNNGSGGQPEVANMPFKIPSCCKCVLKSNSAA